MFVSKIRAYASEALDVAILKGRLLALPEIIRPGWKGVIGTNTPAYYENS